MMPPTSYCIGCGNEIALPPMATISVQVPETTVYGNGVEIVLPAKTETVAAATTFLQPRLV